MKARFDPVERRIEALVKRLDAEEFTIQVEYDTNNRHANLGWPKDWSVEIAWCDRGWRNHPSDKRTASGIGSTLTDALNRLDERVNSMLVRDGLAQGGDESG